MQEITTKQPAFFFPEQQEAQFILSDNGSQKCI
jgi:hypothetical protein